MYLIGLAVQMYEAEDLKARIAAGGGEGARRKRTSRPSPYEAPNCQDSGQGSATPTGSRVMLSQRVTTQTADDTVSSSSDACTSVRDLNSRCRGPTKSTSMTTIGVRDAKSQNVRKQPLTLVELLTAGVERPPHGPPRITTQHQSGQQLHPQRQPSSDLQRLPAHHQAQQTVHQQRHHQQLHHQAGQHPTHESVARLGGSSGRCIVDRVNGSDRLIYNHHQQQQLQRATSQNSGKNSLGDENELGSRSCIVQLLRCPRSTNSVNDDAKQRTWSSSLTSNQQHFETASGEGPSPVASALFSTSYSTTNSVSSVVSTMSSEPLVAEADSSNLPLDADLLSEIGMLSEQQPTAGATHLEIQLRRDLASVCPM